MQPGRAAAIRSRGRNATFILLPRDREGVHRHCREGTVLRHGLLGYCDQPTPKSAGRSFPGDVLKRAWDAVEKARAASQKAERETAWIEALAAYYQDYAT